MESAPWLLPDPDPGVDAPARGRVVLDSSCAGLTRASIFFARNALQSWMDCRVRPGNDLGAGLAPTAVGIVGIFGPGVTVFSTAVKFARRQLFRRRLHLVVEVNVILLVERLVAVEAGAEIGA